jgi:hypothetical protein
MDIPLLQAPRAGFVAGIRATSRGKWTPKKQATAERYAAEAYPITRPRILRGPRFDYKVEGGQLFNRYTGPLPRHISSASMNWKPTMMTPEFLVEIQDLFRNPNEVVA